MTDLPSPLYGLLAVGAVALAAVLWGASVKLRAAQARGRGVRVYDLGADLRLPAQARSYQIALYLTMKSRAAEQAAVNARAQPR